VLDQMLSTTLPKAHELFEGLHGAMLREGLADALTEASLHEAEAPDRVVALVDLCESTRYLGDADTTATHSLVDALFEAGQAAASHDEVWAVKYVGDGVFLVGRSATAVAEASARAVRVLERLTPLRARAGIARGPVVRRAGDYFGPPVNLAQRLTMVAEPGILLVSEHVASRLDGSLQVTERREVEVRGFEFPVPVAVIRL
jgi:adenylate cyclase